MKVSEAIEDLEKKRDNALSFRNLYAPAESGWNANQQKADVYSAAIRVVKQIDEPQAEKVEARLAEHWNEDMGDVLWWDFPVEEPPYCGTPLDEQFPKYKTHFTTVVMPSEIEKPKRWVVRQGGSEVWYLQGFRNSLDGDIVKQWCSHEGCIKFTDKSKAEAVATLVEGSVEEV